MTRARIVAFVAIAPLFPAAAADVVFGGTAQVRLGYVDNPFLQSNSPGGSVQVGGTIAPQLTRRTSLGETVLSGSYDRQQYLSHYNYSDTIAADLRQRQQFSERLSGAFHAGYSNSLNPFLGSNLNQAIVDPLIVDRSIIDTLTVGQRTQQYTADANLAWTPTQRDNLSFGANYVRSTYNRSRSGLVASNFSSYGGNVSYLRAFGARTKVGLQAVVNHTTSAGFGDSTSYQPSLVLQQTLSEYWVFNGSVGAIFQRSGAPVRRSTRSLGFNASLCGTYPHHSICFTGSRSTAASGIGGLRTDLRFGTRINYQLSERSTVTASADISNSKARSVGIAAGNQKFRQASLDYSRTLTERLSAGFGARYQWRSLQPLGTARALAATLNLSVRFGRTR